MITLTGTLQTAQRSASAAPYVEAYVDDRPVELPRLEWTEVYEEVWAGDRPSAAVLTFDNSIVRAIARDSGAGVYSLHVQRITDPSVVGQWSTWSAALAAVGGSDNSVALYADNASALVRVFYVHDTSRQVRCMTSNDNGATWGAWELVADAGADVVRGIAASWAGGDGVVVWGRDPLGAEPDDYLNASRWDGAAWATAADGGKQYYEINSLGVARHTDNVFYVVVSSNYGLSLTGRQYTIGGGFTGDDELIVAGSGSSYTYHDPHVRAPAGVLPRVAVTVWESYVNVGVATHKTARIFCSPSWEWLGNEVAVYTVGSKNHTFLLRSNTWYLIGSLQAYSAPAYVSGTQRQAVTADVVVVDVDERGEMKEGGMVLVLDNSDATYQNAGVSGTYKYIRTGAQVAVKLGYTGTAGNEAVWASPWWVERVSFEDYKGEGYLRIECIDAWGWLERIVVRRQVTFTSQTMNYILLRVLWAVCNQADAVLHANLNVTIPTFVWTPGESLADIARRLLKLSGLWLRFKTDQASSNGAGWDSVAVDVVVVGSGASVYSYGSASHRVARGQYGLSSLRPNEFGVVGRGVESYQIDYDAVQALGRVLYQWKRDKKLDTAAKVDALADYLDYDSDVDVERGFLQVQANVGQQVGDVVDITDSRAGLAAATRRVGAISTSLDRKRGKFEQKIKLMGV